MMPRRGGIGIDGSIFMTPKYIGRVAYSYSYTKEIPLRGKRSWRGRGVLVLIRVPTLPTLSYHNSKPLIDLFAAFAFTYSELALSLPRSRVPDSQTQVPIIVRPLPLLMPYIININPFFARYISYHMIRVCMICTPVKHLTKC